MSKLDEHEAVMADLLEKGTRLQQEVHEEVQPQVQPPAPLASQGRHEADRAAKRPEMLDLRHREDGLLDLVRVRARVRARVRVG